MKRHILLLLLVVVVTSVFVQAQPTSLLGPGLGSGRTVFNQNGNRTLYKDTVYQLTGLYFVNSGESLTIQPGTVIMGDTAATLIIERGAQIFAAGTFAQPIIFTSLKPVGSRLPGDWGGVILLGNAPVNQVNPVIEGGIIPGSYGGVDPNDNSGIFRYVRIEYPGYRYQLNNEVNGLTMGGVGRGTQIDHVQVSYSFDDSFEWFGGTVDATYLIAYGGTDDEFDTDFGFQGRVQFAFGMRDPDYWDPTGQSNGFESDNEGTASYNVPRTWARFSNVTMVGPKRADTVAMRSGNTYQYSALLRRGSLFSFYNSVIAGYPGGLSVRDAMFASAANNDSLQIRNLSLAAFDGTTYPVLHQTSSGFTTTQVQNWYTTGGYGNLGGLAAREASALLSGMNGAMTNPNPVPAGGSELATAGTEFTSLNALAGGYFTPTTYRGAFDPSVSFSSSWAGGWTNFDPQHTTYGPKVAMLGPGLGSGRTVFNQNGNRTLYADTTYTLTGLYFVNSGETMTIQPGTVIKGDTAATLIIERGAQIFAAGTVSQPIIFTSNKPAGSRLPGDWGGVILLGNAPVNQVNPVIEGGIIPGSYGGVDPNDNSGIFRYVRIEYPGYRYQLNNEVNGLTMGGVGRGTQIDHVQVSYSFDDSFEWFGGTVDAKNLVAFGGTDDEFDTDFGFQGRVQFAFGMRDPDYWDPTGQSNGFESDNEGTASYNVPRTWARFSNVTMVGPKRADTVTMRSGNTFQYSALLRRGSLFSFYNSVIAGYPGGLSARDAMFASAANNDSLQIRNLSLAAFDGITFPVLHQSSSGLNQTQLNNWFTTAGYGNLGGLAAREASTLLPGLNGPMSTPDPVPAGGSELATAGTSFSFATTSTNLSHGTSWNLRSVSAVPSSYAYASLFPGTVGRPYSFKTGTYTTPNTLENGDGLWVLYSGAGSNTITGTPTTSVSTTVTVGAGGRWVLIGTPSVSVPIANVAISGPATRVGSIYGFEGTYASVTTLEPGKAYWILLQPVGAGGSVTITVGSAGGASSFFDTNANYRGAFTPGVSMSSQWTAGWTNFAPQSIVY